MSRLTDPQRAAIAHAQNEASAPKSELIRLLSGLERAGIETKARRLARIIEDLERWQNS